ncbi:thioredoxin domain-containing protein [Bacillus smithii]|uniref:thioredoxin domain-containing protein n=1 Tax=Bacillus smithii TaxID=1479 RepID=UPI002E1A81F7|nr:thioredoxin domain-containing protein [Bacillus smithii]
MTKDKKANRLIQEKSPYLLQHAYNPVDWYPWGNEAFEKAKSENKPVFVSIGYSTCHWCHVMERESFEDPEVAELLNQYFVAIKVDREERPDIDSVYMTVCQMMTGQGGWPLTVFLTPDKKPFYAGTYFPKNSQYGRPGMMDILPQLHQAYHQDPERIADIGSRLVEALKEEAGRKSEGEVTEEAIHKGFQQLAAKFDSLYGGFGEAPKFPSPHQLLFLFRYYHMTGKESALKMAEKTLDTMVAGGIYDHIGGGFSRYSTDGMWLVPHFEKMLYDNALLMYAYTEAYQITKNERYRRIVLEIADFVAREMTHPEGGFYSAIDADSEGEEGKFYVWSKKEIMDVLGDELGAIFSELYHVTDQGNFEGKNILHLLQTDPEKIAANHHLSVEDLENLVSKAKRLLFQAREKRVKPHVDDKVLTSWNGLMIAALAKAGSVFEEPDLLGQARKAMAFLEKYVWKEKKLMARFREGEAKYHGYLDDYAFLLWGTLELFLAEDDLRMLSFAIELKNTLFERFWDENGGFFFTDRDGEELLVREKPVYDGAYPSGNSVAAYQLWRLAKLTGDMELMKRVEMCVRSFSKELNAFPVSMLYMLEAVMALIVQGREVIVIGSNGFEKGAVLRRCREQFLPFDVWSGHRPEWLKGAARQKETDFLVFICENQACKMPMEDLSTALKAISRS